MTAARHPQDTNGGAGSMSETEVLLAIAFQLRATTRRVDQLSAALQSPLRRAEVSRALGALAAVESALCALANRPDGEETPPRIAPVPERPTEDEVRIAAYGCLGDAR